MNSQDPNTISLVENEVTYDEGDSRLTQIKIKGIEPHKKPGTCLLISMMITIAFSWCGGVFFYDFPQLFTEVIIKKFRVSTVEVAFLYSIASAPTAVFTPIMSLLTEHIGLNSAAVLFSSSIFYGILVCFIGLETDNFTMLVVGRGIFGLAYESAYVVQASAIEKWFTGRFLSMGFAFSRCLCYLLSSTAAYTLPLVFVSFRTLSVPIFIYAAVAFFCCIMAFFFFILDWKNEDILEKNPNIQNDVEEKFTVKDLRRVPLQAWLMVLLFATSSNCFFQFTNLGTDCLMKRFGFSYLEAKNRMAMVPMVNMFMIPVFASIVSCIGKKGVFLTGGCVFITLNYLMMASFGTDGDERVVVGVVGVGIFYSILTATFWSSFSLILPQQAVTVMFGIAISTQNFFLAVLPPVFSYLNKDRTPAAYQKCFYLLMGISSACSLLSLGITIDDIRGSKAMHLPENNKLVKENRERISTAFSLSAGTNSAGNSRLSRSFVAKGKNDSISVLRKEAKKLAQDRRRDSRKL